MVYSHDIIYYDKLRHKYENGEPCVNIIDRAKNIHWLEGVFHSDALQADRTDIKNNAWVTVNNDFRVTSEAICQRFSRVTKSRVKIMGKSHHKWPQIVIHGNECIILFLTRYLMSWTHNSVKNNNRSLISQLSPRMVVCDLALWRHHSGSVTSREREILALWRHIRRLFSHAQIGAKAIFTSE